MIVGTRLNGRYTLRQRLGAGGVAEVCLATDERLGRDVAVKLLHPGTASDPSFARRFQREAQSAAALNHPNVVAVYDWGSADGADFMVMEYVPGPNLKEEIERRGPLPEDEALRIAEGVASALQAAHRRGIIHRDIKPHNILLEPDGRAKVADFGIAQAVDTTRLTLPNTVCGTAQYLSPEAAQGQPANERSDIYSLGIVIYEMLTGRVPFQADTPVGVAMQHVHDAPVPPRQVNPALSPLVDALVMKALAKDPTQRYRSAGDMRQEMGRIRRSLEPAAPTPPAPTVTTPAPVKSGKSRTSTRTTGKARAPVPPRKERRSPPPVTRRESHFPTWAILLGAIVLLLGGGGVLAHTLAGGTSHQAQPIIGTPLPANRPAVLGSSRHAPTAVPARAPVTRQVTPPARQVVPPIRPVVPMSITSNPSRTVMAFYVAVAHHDFANAAALWTDHMQSACNPTACIGRRFAALQTLEIRQAKVTAQTDTTATVATDVVLNEGSPPTTSEYTGEWYLVKVGNRWLLNGENLNPPSSGGDGGE